MAWNPPRLNSVKDPAARANLQSLKEYLLGLGTGGGGGASPLRGFTVKDDPVIQQTNATNSWTTIDATLAVTYTVPDSGKVFVDLSALTSAAAGTSGNWGIDDGTGTVDNGQTAYDSNQSHVHCRFYLSGQTPGDSITLTWVHKRTSGAGVYCHLYGGEAGPATMSVIDAEPLAEISTGGSGGGALPVGGTSGQWLKKLSATDGDADWAGITSTDVSGLGSLATLSTVDSAHITNGTIVDGDVNASAAIAYSKLALTGSILNADLAGGIAYSKLSLTGAIVNADLAGSIAYSKLALTGAILNADLAGSIAYSKLSLTGAITNSDLAGSIAYSKLVLTGAVTNADLAGSIAWSKITTTGAVVNADVSASAAIAYSKLDLAGSITNADLAGAIAYSKLSLSGAITNSDLAGSIAYSKLSLTGAILNADLAGSIAYSKLSLSNSILNADIAASAGIVWSKISANQSVTGGNTGDILVGTITNANINSSAAIAYSKLNLTGAILNADLAGSIAYSKLSLTGAILNADLAGSIALTKMATQADQTILGNVSGGTASPSALTASQIRKALRRTEHLTPAGAFAETCTRADHGAVTVVSGTMYVTLLELETGDQVTSISFRGIGAASVPTHWWFALYNAAGTLLSQTADQTTTAWGANTTKTVALGAAQTPGNVAVYVAFLMTATTPVTLAGVGGNATFQGVAPVVGASANTGLTTTAPGTIGTTTGFNMLWASVS